MKLPLFKIDQAVVCLKGGPWIIDHPHHRTGATMGKRYTISGMEYWPQWDDWYLQLAECPADAAFCQEHFSADLSLVHTQGEEAAISIILP